MTLYRIKNHVLVSLSWISTVQYLFIKMTIYSFVGGLTNGDTRVEKNIVSGINCVYIMGFSKNSPYPRPCWRYPFSETVPLWNYIKTFTTPWNFSLFFSFPPPGIPSKLLPPPGIFLLFFLHPRDFQNSKYPGILLSSIWVGGGFCTCNLRSLYSDTPDLLRKIWI